MLWMWISNKLNIALVILMVTNHYPLPWYDSGGVRLWYMVRILSYLSRNILLFNTMIHNVILKTLINVVLHFVAVLFFLEIVFITYIIFSAIRTKCLYLGLSCLQNHFLWACVLLEYSVCILVWVTFKTIFKSLHISI